MATITIRDLDDKIVAHLKERAARHNRSLESEIRQILAESIEAPPRKELLELAKCIRDMTPDVPQTDSAELIREDRDTDHGRDP